MSDYGLSKSRLMDALQCPKLLWVSVREPERIVFGADTQRIFAMGHQIGAVAQTLHPGGVLIGGAERFPDLAGRLQAVIARIVDLLPIVKRNYYHPDMRGSWSLKAVLPTVAPDLDYGDLDEVQDGVLAQVAYEEAIAPGTSPERRETIRRNLLRYCERDTLAMVRLVEYFQ